MKQATITLTTLAIVFGALMLCYESKPFVGGFFFVPFSLGPLFVTLVLAAFLSSKRAQFALLVSAVLYCAWFVYAYLDIFYIHLDPQSAIGLLFVGLFSLPIMAILWITAGVLQAKPTPALQ